MTDTNTRKQELIDKAYALGYEYEGKYGGCAPSAFSALVDAFGVRNAETDAIFRGLNSLSGGISGQGDGSCGGYIGAIAFMGYLRGRTRDNFADPDRIRRQTDALVDKLHQKFLEKYGSVTCHSIHRVLYGRPYYIKDPDEFRKFEAAGAHETGCTSVVGEAARWAAEILLDAGWL